MTEAECNEFRLYERLIANSNSLSSLYRLKVVSIEPYTHYVYMMTWPYKSATV